MAYSIVVQDKSELTLEVLDDNIVTKTAYENFGFQGYQLVPEHGQAVFMEKKL